MACSVPRLGLPGHGGQVILAERVRALRSQPSSLLVAVTLAVLTLAVAALPALRFAYDARMLRVALEAAAAVIALVVSYLSLGRFLRGRELHQLLLAWALALLAFANLGLALVLAVWRDPHARLATTSLSVVGAGLLAAAAFASGRKLRPTGRLVAPAAAASILGAALVYGLLHVSITWFPPELGNVLERDTSRPQLGSNRGLLAIQVPLIVSFALAAIGFSRRVRIARDPFIAALAVGATLAAFGRLHYLLMPAIRTDMVYTGDLLRFAFYAVLLAGGAREIGEYWRGLAATAVLEERRRIARDLHDGMAQELAFIVRRARRLGAAGHSEDARVIAGAAERALGESRRAIAALTRPLDAPLADVLTEALEEVVARHPVELKLELEREIAPDGDTREALVRIACEAVSNAARHADAAVVRVALRQNGGIRFSVADDGVGFDQSESAPGRFGLISMRERTVALGGSFSIRSAPGSGTEILVQLP